MTADPSMSVQVGPFRISREFVDDVMATALEGGINYWCSNVEVEPVPTTVEWGSDALTEGHTLKIREPEENEGLVHELTLEKFVQGLLLWVETKVGEIDANEADAIVQYAIFGDVIYG